MSRFLREGKTDKSEYSADVEAVKKEGEESYDAFVDSGGSGGESIEVSEITGGERNEPQEPNLPISTINLAVATTMNPEKYKACGSLDECFDYQTSIQSSDNAKELKVADKTYVENTNKSCDGKSGPRKKAKIMRLERRQAKLAAKGATNSEAKPIASTKSAKNQEKTLSDYIANVSPEDKHKLQVILIPSKRVTDETFNLYKKYQLLVHNDDPDRITASSLERFCYKSPIKYTKTRDGPTSGYGSFHQQYWLDNKLIAVAVIDILPRCVSSVYFFYDPDYSFLSLGTYGSLREIELVQQLSKKVPALKDYYMGFYIHSCPKMRYKGRLVPSYLLCPETYTWHLLTDEIFTKLDQHKYQRFSSNPDEKDADSFEETDLNDVGILYDNMYLTYRQYIQITGQDNDPDLIHEYGKLVGKSLARRMLYVKT